MNGPTTPYQAVCAVHLRTAVCGSAAEAASVTAHACSSMHVIRHMHEVPPAQQLAGGLAGRGGGDHMSSAALLL